MATTDFGIETPDQKISRLLASAGEMADRLENKEISTGLKELGGFIGGMYQLPVAKCEELATSTSAMLMLRSWELGDGRKELLEGIHSDLLMIAITVLEHEVESKRKARPKTPFKEPPSEKMISIWAEEADCHEQISKLAHKLRIANIEIEHTKRAADLWENVAQIAIEAGFSEKAVRFYRRSSEQRVNHLVTLRLVDSGEYYNHRMR